jgi:sigma-B regulation protein RsbU (phosphoserine phosphatase)
MEEFEPVRDSEIRDFVTTRLKQLSESYSVLNVGHITKFIDPINRSIRVSEALSLFSATEGAESMPIEGDSGVIGIVHKADILKKKPGLMSDPSVESYLDNSLFSIDASENCEKAMIRILDRPRERLYDDFMIYERGRYFGIGTFADLSKNIAAIRNADLEKARNMQEYLMGRNAVAAQGMAVERFISMAHQIGGDYVQCMDLSESLSMLACFDVCGKGTAAALLASILSSFFSTLKTSGQLPSCTPSSIVSTLNKVVLDQTPEEIFVAGEFLFVDRAKREAIFFNCGSPPPYVFFVDPESGKAKGKIIHPDLMPLGISEFDEPRGNAFPLLPNFRVFMYSDGLTEARNERGELYGDERLRKFLFPRYLKKASEIARDLKSEIEAFVGEAPKSDDITALVAEIW